MEELAVKENEEEISEYLAKYIFFYGSPSWLAYDIDEFSFQDWVFTQTWTILVLVDYEEEEISSPEERRTIWAPTFGVFQTDETY
jgi:hypothetical protein